MAHSHEFIGWPTLLALILDRRDLDAAQAESAITQILNGNATPSQMTAFVVAMRAKGETIQELEGMLHAVRSAGMKVHLSAEQASRAIDIVGTGG
jgi:anthranilate phosphoribosyltransferase